MGRSPPRGPGCWRASLRPPPSRVASSLRTLICNGLADLYTFSSSGGSIGFGGFGLKSGDMYGWTTDSLLYCLAILRADLFA